MPYDSKAQEHFFEAVRHGWKPDHVKAPPKAVTEKFHREEMKRKHIAKALRGK